jgi:hypothetical protein
MLGEGASRFAILYFLYLIYFLYFPSFNFLQ